MGTVGGGRLLAAVPGTQEPTTSEACMMQIPRRMPARILDTAIESLYGMCVPHIHLVVDFDGRLDSERLAKALRLTMDAEPVLGCRFVRRWAWPYWERVADERLGPEQLLTEERGAEVEDTTQRFLAAPLDTTAGPQVRGLLVDGPAGDRLLLKVHHTAADAGGTKEVGYILARLYRDLETKPRLSVEPNLGSRSQVQIYRRFLPRHLLGLLRRMWRDSRDNSGPLRSLRIGCEGPREGPPRFHFRTQDGARHAAIAALARRHDATLNDVAMAALLRGLTALAPSTDGRGRRLIGTVDLRRHVPDARADAVCNLSGFMFPRYRGELGDDLPETLDRVRAVHTALKRDYLGLAFNLGGFLTLGWLPFGWRHRLVGWMFAQGARRGITPHGLTNMGLIDERQLAFGGPDVGHAFLVVPACAPGALIAGLSGFRDSLTWSLGVYDSAMSPAAARRLLDAVDGELPDSSSLEPG